MVADDEGFLHQKAGLIPRRDELLGLCRVHGERLFAQHMFARFERLDRPRHMQIIGEGIVHHVDFRIVDQRLIGTMGARDAEFRRQRLGGIAVAAGDRAKLEAMALLERRNDMFDGKARGTQDSPADGGHGVSFLVFVDERIVARAREA